LTEILFTQKFSWNLPGQLNLSQLTS